MWIKAGLLALFTSSALLIGSFIGYRFNLPQKVVASIMAFGSGVLISAVSFQLVEEAFIQAGYKEVIIGFLIGALIYTFANIGLNKLGGKHRKRSNLAVHGETNDIGITLGALLDGIPESLVIGVSLIEGGAISVVTIGAIFISNFPEGLSSTVGMKKRGKSKGFIFSIWIGIMILSVISAIIGNIVFAKANPSSIAMVMALAGGAILAMIVDTMIPEAFEETHNFTGLITVLGFLTAFLLEKL